MVTIGQPDPVGRTLIVGVLIWGVVGVVVLLAFTLAFPHRAPPIQATLESKCKASVSVGLYDPTDPTDLVRPVLGKPSRCAASATDLEATLHAYLDGAEIDSSPHAPAPTVDPALVARGGVLYQEHCATCHGTTGDGTGRDACALEPIAANLRKGVFAIRTTEHEALPTDEDIFRTITRGAHGTAMPPWFVLPEHDRWALVAYVKTLSKQFEEDTAPPSMESTPEPAATPERIAGGHTLYDKGGCASCHGPTGHGDGPAAAAFTVHPRDFTSGRFHRASTAADIHETLMTGLDGTPMASFAKVMTTDELWNVSLYVHGLVPAMTDGKGVRCPEMPRSYDAQELFGARNLMHTTHNLRVVP